MKNKKGILKGIIGTVIGLVVVIGVAFFVYVGQYYHTDEAALNLVTENTQLTSYYEDDNLYLAPKNQTVKTGIIFYPGAKVEYTAYAPLMADLAEEGYLTCIVKMPYNLAIFDMDAAEQVMAAHKEIEHWYIAGHSLGGAMAANYIGSNEVDDKVEGLILLASYSTVDLSYTDLGVLSIYGSEDKVLNRESLEEGRAYMPTDYEEICIEGGNHAYYGNYGEQKGDGIATISREAQQQQAKELITHFLEQEESK